MVNVISAQQPTLAVCTRHLHCSLSVVGARAKEHGVAHDQIELLHRQKGAQLRVAPEHVGQNLKVMMWSEANELIVSLVGLEDARNWLTFKLCKTFSFTNVLLSVGEFSNNCHWNINKRENQC